ncbi:hypothetical protein KQX54_009390 [Cotesia glomerata]|uniref:Uncharacterized protein n=1 Tax=Cotesia glomerata TaxID=32391 RepID=A0AAV7INQ9_COTGL|nr:hypothetical protein KQX54_009390 [Cotesia glomerata]
MHKRRYENENEDIATSGFEKPKRTAKRTLRTDNVGASTSNTFNTLGEHSNEEIEKIKPWFTTYGATKQ